MLPRQKTDLLWEKRGGRENNLMTPKVKDAGAATKKRGKEGGETLTSPILETDLIISLQSKPPFRQKKGAVYLRNPCAW